MVGQRISAKFEKLKTSHLLSLQVKSFRWVHLENALDKVTEVEQSHGQRGHRHEHPIGAMLSFVLGPSPPQPSPKLQSVVLKLYHKFSEAGEPWAVLNGVKSILRPKL